jgi:hypothetical protein
MNAHNILKINQKGHTEMKEIYIPYPADYPQQ